MSCQAIPAVGTFLRINNRDYDGYLYRSLAWDDVKIKIQKEEDSKPGKRKSMVCSTMSCTTAVLPEPPCPMGRMLKVCRCFIGASFCSSSQTALQAAFKIKLFQLHKLQTFEN